MRPGTLALLLSFVLISMARPGRASDSEPQHHLRLLLDEDALDPGGRTTGNLYVVKDGLVDSDFTGVALLTADSGLSFSPARVTIDAGKATIGITVGPTAASGRKTVHVDVGGLGADASLVVNCLSPPINDPTWISVCGDFGAPDVVESGDVVTITFNGGCAPARICMTGADEVLSGASTGPGDTTAYSFSGWQIIPSPVSGLCAIGVNSATFHINRGADPICTSQSGSGVSGAAVWVDGPGGYEWTSLHMFRLHRKSRSPGPPPGSCNPHVRNGILAIESCPPSVTVENSCDASSVIADRTVDSVDDPAKCTVTITNNGGSDVTDLNVDVDVTPAFNVSKVEPGSGGSIVTWPKLDEVGVGKLKWLAKTVKAKNTLTLTYKLTPAKVAVADGVWLPNVANWDGSSFLRGPRKDRDPDATTTKTGGNLVFSNMPEGYPEQHNRNSFKADGSVVEGILYRQMDVSSNGKFRVFVEHLLGDLAFVKAHNPHPQFDLFLVFYNNGSSDVIVQSTAEGIQHGRSDYIAIGVQAMNKFLTAHFKGGTVVHTWNVPKGKAKVYRLVNKGVEAGDAIDAILDLNANAPIQIGVVVLNSGHANEFAASPLRYAFNDSGTTYLHMPVIPADEKNHTRGTFEHSDREVEFNSSRFDAASHRYAWRLGEQCSRTQAIGCRDPRGEYEEDLDTGENGNKKLSGNYGVLYHVVFPSVAAPVQFLIENVNPAEKYGGPLWFNGALLEYKSKNEGYLDPYEAEGIGRAKSGVRDLYIMSPGHVGLPLAVIASPSYFSTKATATFSGKTAESKSVMVTITPKGGSVTSAVGCSSHGDPSPSSSLPLLALLLLVFSRRSRRRSRFIEMR